MGSIPGLGQSLGAGSGNPLQYSCLDRGAWCFSAWSCKERDAAEHTAAAAVQAFQSCPSLGDPMYCSPSGSSVHGSLQECWSGLPCPPPGDLPNLGIDPRSPALQADSLPLSYQGSPIQRACARAHTHTHTHTHTRAHSIVKRTPQRGDR